MNGTGASHLSYVRLGWLTPEIQDGDYLEYDVYLKDDVAGVGGLDFAGEGADIAATGTISETQTELRDIPVPI